MGHLVYFICPLFSILFDLYATFIYFLTLFYFHLDPRDTGRRGTQQLQQNQQHRSSRRYLMQQDRQNPAQDDMGLEDEICTTSISTLTHGTFSSIEQPNRVIIRLNWNMCRRRLIYTPPQPYIRPVYTSPGSVNFVHYPPLLSGSPCSNLSYPSGVPPFLLLPLFFYQIKWLAQMVLAGAGL